MKVPIWINIGFQQRDRQDSQNLNNDTFCRLSVTKAQCIISKEKHPDSAILLNYDKDDYIQSYSPIKEAFRALSKNDILQQSISDDDFRFSNVRADDNGYILFIFHIRYQQNSQFPKQLK